MAIKIPTDLTGQISFYKSNKDIFNADHQRMLDAELRNYEDPTTSADDLDRFASNFQRIFNKRAKTIQSGVQETKDGINDELIALANKTDFSALDATAAAKEIAGLIDNPDIAGRLAKIQAGITDLQRFGEDTSSYEASLADFQDRLATPAADLAGTQFTPAGVGTIDGNFVTAEEQSDYARAVSGTAVGALQGAVGRTGELLGITTNADGEYDVIGRDTDTVYGTYATQAEALAAQTELQSGATPGATGGTTTGTGSYTSTILDAAGINYNGLTKSEIEDLEAIYESAGDSSLVNSALTSTSVFDVTKISDEDVSAFLDEAREFITGKGSAYEQTIIRAKENFERTLQFQAEAREAQIAQEKLDLAMGLEATAESSAEAGLATSGIRQKAEERMQEQAENIAASSRRGFDFNIGEYVRGTEDLLGSANLSDVKLPALSGVSLPSITEGVRGSLERQAETDVQLKADEIEAQALARKQEILASAGNTTTF